MLRRAWQTDEVDALFKLKNRNGFLEGTAWKRINSVQAITELAKSSDGELIMTPREFEQSVKPLLAPVSRVTCRIFRLPSF